MLFKIVLLLITIFLKLNKIEPISKFNRGKKFNYDLKKILLTKSTNNITDLFFDQKLDHFNEALKIKWKQRYWVNKKYFDKRIGAVFLMIGGEGEQDSVWIAKGYWIELAKKFKALCVLIEHRFYGQSRPTEDLSIKNLSYLNSEQALGDLANFRQFIHRKFNLTNSNRWIAFGGSYPGSLSAWLRLKYPHLVHAAVSSSAPVLAIINFSEYLVVVNNSLHDNSPECPKQINKAIQQIKKLVSTTPGKKTIEKTFKICEPIVSDDDLNNFFSYIIGHFQGAVQYNKNNRMTSTANNVTIDSLCKIMNDEKIEKEFQRYAIVNDIVLDTYNQTCLDVTYNKYIKLLKSTSWDQPAGDGYRQWFYQTCIEFGFFQSTDSNSQPFGHVVPVDFYTQQCKDIFGSKFDLKLLRESVLKTNTHYGGFNYEGSRVVFVNGKVDPWHALSFTKKAPNNLTETIFIKDTAHCADMYQPNENDVPQLKHAREKISQLIANWLKQ